MKIEVRVFATFRKQVTEYLGQSTEDAFYVELPADSTLKDLLNAIGLGKEKVIIPLINGLRQEENYSLAEGDRVGLFPPVGGG